MTARARLIAGLKAAKLRVDDTGTETNWTDGVVVVVTENASAGDVLRFSVCACVNVGQDVDAFGQRVIKAIDGIPGFAAVESTVEYNSTPISRWGLTDADIMRVTVLSTTLFGE